MLRLLLSSLLGLALLCGSAAAQKDAPKKDAPAKEEPKGHTVKVKSVDEKTHMLVVTTAEGKSLTFKIEKEIKIVGPRGGVSDDRLKDDRLAAGHEVTLFYGTDGKTLKEIKLGFRKKAPEKDKPTVKDKPSVKDKP